MSLNADSELVASIAAGYDNDYYGHQLKKLLGKNLKKGIEVGVVARDKGYDDGENH